MVHRPRDLYRAFGSSLQSDNYHDMGVIVVERERLSFDELYNELRALAETRRKSRAGGV